MITRKKVKIVKVFEGWEEASGVGDGKGRSRETYYSWGLKNHAN